MLDYAMLRLRAYAHAAVRRGMYSIIALLFLLTAFAFLAGAGFVWAQAEYGTIQTMLGFGGVFMLIGLIVVAAAYFGQSSSEQPSVGIAHAGASAPWWLDPRYLSAGISIGRAFGPRRSTAAVLAGAFFVGLLLSRIVSARSDSERG